MSEGALLLTAAAGGRGLALGAQLPALQVVAPLLGAILCAFLRKGVLAWAIASLVTWAMPVVALALLWRVESEGTISYAMGGWAPPWGIEYRVDALTAFVLLLVSGAAALMMPFARKSVAGEVDGDKQAWFYTMFLLCLAGLLGITITGDAFNAFVFLEISSLSTYVMIALGRDRRALVAAYQYLIMGTIGATLYVLGVGLLYTLTGTLNLVDLGTRLDAIGMTPPVLAALSFLTVGISLKLALFPLHAWLPGAYAYAPSFVTAFLAATATKVAVYLLVRYLYGVFPLARMLGEVPLFELLVALSIAGMLGASLVAVFQDNVKRLLAYSSVAQVGYIMLGVGLANEPGLTGGLAHLMNHAVTKAALFLAVGAAYYRLCTVRELTTLRLSDLAGLGRQMPVTLGIFTLGGLSIIGVPGTAGFISKWYLALGALEQGWWWVVAAIMASSLIAVVYIGRVIEVAWFRPAATALAEAGRPNAAMYLSMAAFAALTVYLGFATEWSVGLAGHAARVLLELAP